MGVGKEARSGFFSLKLKCKKKYNKSSVSRFFMVNKYAEMQGMLSDHF